MSFIRNEQLPQISAIVRIDDVRVTEIPFSDSLYRCWGNRSEQRFDVTVECTGLQDSKDYCFPVQLLFYLGVTQKELDRIKRIYAKGKILKVTGEYKIKKSDESSLSTVEISYPEASPLPMELIRIHEDIMGEGYMPQWTQESSYQVNLWLDDIRSPPMGYELVAKTAQEAIMFLKDNKITRISLDHDLGGEENGTGYDVAQFIEQGAFYGTLSPMEVTIHSANPVGRTRMEQAINNARKYWKSRELEEMNQ